MTKLSLMNNHNQANQSKHSQNNNNNNNNNKMNQNNSQAQSDYQEEGRRQRNEGCKDDVGVC
ncbi:hypothetical protein A2U01_0084987 [Trifolium medium]|uniref:Uncharacterized protein n=1 Tax=Trifolium medium TaxID=97028 RepID=A0A392TTY0_9FABA|nr:hypothetical protein [Trifolium medium]